MREKLVWSPRAAGRVSGLAACMPGQTGKMILEVFTCGLRGFSQMQEGVLQHESSLLGAGVESLPNQGEFNCESKQTAASDGEESDWRGKGVSERSGMDLLF